MIRRKLPDCSWGEQLRGAQIIRFHPQALFRDYSRPGKYINFMELWVANEQDLKNNTTKIIQFFNFTILSQIKDPSEMIWQDFSAQENNNIYTFTIYGEHNEEFSFLFEDVIIKNQKDLL